MEKTEIVKEIRALLAAKQSEQSVFSFLKDLGFNEEDSKQLMARAKEGYAIEKDLEKLRDMDKGNEDEEEKELNPAEKRVQYVRDQIGDIQDIIKTMKQDVGPQEKKGTAQKKSK